MICDFRSDTVTKPCQGMLDAMVSAEVGDDVYEEDPSVAALEADTAAMLGKEAAIFVSSGTMANQIALNLATRPGEAVLCEEESHIFWFEGGAAAANSGLQPRYVRRLTPEAISEAYVGPGIHTPMTKLISLENTHNMGSGRMLDPTALEGIWRTAGELGVAVHCDGARLWNAAAELGVSEARLVQGCASVSVCFSKGLGAPVGSALAGSRALIDEARKIRKRWGGAMRQLGYMAAAARFALHHNRARLKIDHKNAHDFAQAFRASIDVDYPTPGSNIVFFRLRLGSSQAFLEHCRGHGILLQALGRDRIRAVWHKDLPDGATAKLSEVLRQFLAKG